MIFAGIFTLGNFLFSVLTLSIFLFIVSIFYFLLSKEKAENLFLIFLLFSFFTVFNPEWHNGKISGDGVGYFSYLRSWVYDKDLDFENEFITLNAYKYGIGKFRNGKYRRLKRTGMVGDPFSIGPALLWAPFYIFLKGLFQFPTGYESGLLLGVQWATWFYGLLGVLFLFLFLRKYYPPFPVAFSIVTVLLASPLLFYMKEAYMSHALSFFSISLLLYVLSKSTVESPWWRWSLVGATCGLSFLVRWQNGLLILLPLVWIYAELLEDRVIPRKKLLQATINAGLTLILFFIIILPQFWVFKKLYGSYLTLPQGKKFMTFPIHLIQSLFSSFHGFFNWHPLLILGLLGLALFWKLRRKINTISAGGFSLQAMVNGSLRQFWAGASFGARRYVGSLAFLAVGFSNIASALKRRSRMALFMLLDVFVLLNFLTERLFSLGKIPHEKPFGIFNITCALFHNINLIRPKEWVFFVFYILLLSITMEKILTLREGTTGPRP